VEIVGPELHQRERSRSMKSDDVTITDRRIAISPDPFAPHQDRSARWDWVLGAMDQGHSSGPLDDRLAPPSSRKHVGRNTDLP
jgi:hypothetical protein